MPDIKEQSNRDEQKFQETFDKLSKNQPVPQADTSIYEQFTSGLGHHIEALFQTAERDRRMAEMSWVKDLRQYRGEYEPKILARINKLRSKANLSITRTKVKTISSRLTDLLFPANGEKNWSITKTPMPDLNPVVIQQIMQQYEQQTQQPATEDMIRKFINEEADKRCHAMSVEMDDQLTDLRYREIIRNVILSGNLFGTGILKGPLVKTVKSKRWLPHGNDWATIEMNKMRPYCEHVPIWDIYPDMGANKPDDMRYIFQRYVMPRNKVFGLAKRQDFNSGAIIAYLKAHPTGDADYRAYETDLRTINQDNQAPGGSNIPLRKDRYEIKEFWGYVNTDDLVTAGIDVDENELGIEVAANIWILGPLVIKAVISPIEGVTFPYQWYYYTKDDTSIWGEGIPSIMRDPQSLYNASVRAMLDNAAISAGPIVEVNMDLLEPGEKPRELHPFKVFLRQGQGADAQSPAVRVSEVPSYTNELMALAQFFENSADEITAIPRYMYGDSNQMGGAGKTATGLSMMMGAANVTLKDQVKNFDDGITVPFVKALYHWNMQFNSKEFIKGDYNVKAKGSTSLIAREVKAESLNQFIMTTNNPTDLTYTNRDQVLREYVKVLDLDDLDLIKDSNTVKEEQKQQATQAEKDKAFEQKLAIIKATSGGHMSNNPAAATPGMNPQMQPVSQQDLQQGAVPEVKDATGNTVTAGSGV